MIVTNNNVIMIITYAINVVSLLETLFLFMSVAVKGKHVIIYSCLIDLIVNIGYDCSTLIVEYSDN